MTFYPLKFKTIFKEKIWGGNKIRSILGKDFSPLSNCGEIWELSGVNGDVSVVNNGFYKGKSLKDLVFLLKDDLLGEGIFEKTGEEFPLLIKFIDANADLSIQVHPDDKLALERHNSLGKTEMWYLLQADENATLISGFNRDTNADEYVDFLETGRLSELLNKERVFAKDVFNIPAGRVHTIGKGCLLAEIQQTSDVTYRIYDFDRVDKDGNKRELHTELALDALDYKSYDSYKTQYEVSESNKICSLVKSQYFHTSKIVLVDNKLMQEDQSSFTILIGVDGDSTVCHNGEVYDLNYGEVVLIPAALMEYTITPKNTKSEILHVRLK